VRKIPRLIRFFRIPELIDESMVRLVLEQIKKLNISRAVIVTSSGFSRTALEFADSRPIELYNKDQLQELFNTVDIYGSLRHS
jgi:hypothetical protein